MKKPNEKFKVWGDVFDNFAIVTIQKLMDKGCFDDIIGPISVGKEANVFYASRDDGASKVAIKIYRLETCDFNRMYDYIRADPRFAGMKKRRRQVIFSWCQREYRNLMKAREAGVSAPFPIAFKNNVLVSEFIGDEMPASKLKDEIPKDIPKFAADVFEQMRKLCKADFVHTDLSEFNILNYHEKPVFIDFSQATTKDNSNFNEYWARDVKNICKFFKKHGLTINEEHALEWIYGQQKEMPF